MQESAACGPDLCLGAIGSGLAGGLGLTMAGVVGYLVLIVTGSFVCAAARCLDGAMAKQERETVVAAGPVASPCRI